MQHVSFHSPQGEWNSAKAVGTGKTEEMKCSLVGGGGGEGGGDMRCQILDNCKELSVRLCMTTCFRVMAKFRQKDY